MNAPLSLAETPSDVVSPQGDGATLALATCLNCLGLLTGPFCAACGQSAATPEHVTFSSLWTDFRVNKLGLDRGFFVTVRDVLIRPGVVALAFVEGRRRTYVHPLAFLFVAYGLYAVVFGFIDAALMATLASAMPASAVAGPGLSPAESAALTAQAANWTRFAVTYGPYFSLLTVLPFGFLLRKLLPASGRTVAECAVFALTVEAGVTLVGGVVLNPLSAWTGSAGISVLAYGLYFLLTGAGAATFFGRQRRTVGRALVAQALALVVLFVLLMVCGIAYGVFVALRSHGAM